MRATLMVVLSLSACTGTISSTSAPPTDAPVDPAIEPKPVRPRVKDCAGGAALTTAQVFQATRPVCVGCHDTSAELPLFASSTNFEAMVVRNTRFVVPGQPQTSPLLEMLEGTGAAPQMPPPSPYAKVADEHPELPSLADLRCWVEGLELAPPSTAVSASLNRRMYTEYLQANLYWALGISPSEFATSGVDYGLENPDALGSSSSPSQYRAQQLGAPHWLANVPRANEIGATFVQVMVQLSQAWCSKAARAGNTVFFSKASASDGLSTPESTARVRANLAVLFERVTGESPSPETLDGLTELFRLYDTGTPRAGWTATCAAIVRHPLSLTY